MTRRITFTALALLAFASLAHAGIVDPAYSSATIQNPPAVLLVAPGGADSFTIQDPPPSVNHTIDVFVNDSGPAPVEIVASDIWLLNDASVPCPGGWIADSSTFAPDPGHTTFTFTPRGGVALNGLCRAEQTDVVAVGQTIQTLDLRFVSPDLNGDGSVDVADFGVFASAFNLPCSDTRWCADLTKSDEDENDPNPDDRDCVNVGDFGAFAGFFNLSTCP